MSSSNELRVHYDDHVKDLLRLGRDPALAEERALEAMGDAQEVGRALDKVHKPWLGWLWEASRTLALALTVLTLVPRSRFRTVFCPRLMAPPPIPPAVPSPGRRGDRTPLTGAGAGGTGFLAVQQRFSPPPRHLSNRPDGGRLPPRRRRPPRRSPRPRTASRSGPGTGRYGSISGSAGTPAGHPGRGGWSSFHFSNSPSPSLRPG